MRTGNSVLILLAVFLTACVPAAPSEGPVPATQPLTLAPTEALPSTQTLAPAPPTGAVSGWREYRDTRYGYGVSLPCYWQVTPTPAEGVFAAMTARSYTDDFFAQHSERGEWKDGIWPAGAYKLDAVGFEGLDQASSFPDALRAWYSKPENSSEQELVSVDETTFGLQPAYLATLQSGLQGGAKVQIVYFPLGGGRAVGFVFMPDTALESSDVQGILSSFAAAPDEPVSPPPGPPSGPPDGGPITCE